MISAILAPHGSALSHLFDRLERRADWALALLTLLAILLCLANIPGDTILVDNYPDTSWTIATHLYQGGGYTACATKYFPFCGATNQRTAMREPLPVLLFWAVMRLQPTPGAGVMLEVCLYLGVLQALYWSLRKNGHVYALFAAFLWTVSVPVVREIGGGSGQLVAALCLALALPCFQKARESRLLRYWALAGLLLGLAALSRTIVYGIAAGLAAGLMLEGIPDIRSRIRPVLVLLFVFALTVSPWAIRNQMVFGTPIFGSTLSGYNIYRHNHIVAQADFRPHYVGSGEARRAIQALLENAPLTGNENEQQMQDFYGREGTKLVRAHPLRYATLVAFRTLSLWFDVSVKAAYGEALDWSDRVLVGEQMFLLLAALTGAIRHGKKLWPYTLSVLLACGAYVLVSAQARYLVEIMPLIVSLAAAPKISVKWPSGLEVSP